MLKPLLSEYGEILPLTCKESELWIFNPTRKLEALDEKKSTVQRFDNGRIFMIERYVFHADVVWGAHIFKIPQLRASPIFVSQHVVDAWKTAGLTGLDFDRVWTES